MTPNSETLGFGFPLPAEHFNPLTPDSYKFTLSVTASGQTTSNTINMDAMPEPASLSVFGKGLLGLTALRRQRMN